MRICECRAKASCYELYVYCTHAEQTYRVLVMCIRY